MTLEQMCVSLELAKKLKILGIKQDSLFYFCERLTGYHNKTDIKLLINAETKIDEINKYSAFTSSELGEMLPDELTPHTASGYNKKIWHWHTGAMWFSGYQCQNGIYNPVGVSTIESNARAKLLIALIEQGLVKVSDE